MGRVISGITTSIDGYVTGPNDGPGRGLGDGGERLHSWVFERHWSYGDEATGDAVGADREYLDEAFGTMGAVIGGRWTYEAADRWGGRNPWPVPFFVVTHRPEDEPEGAGFTFVSGLDAAMERARAATGDRDVHVMGGADVIRQALGAGYVDEFTLTIAPIVLGAGKRLFEGFERRLELEQLRVRESAFATHITYGVPR